MDPEYRKLIGDNLNKIARSFQLTDKFWTSLEYSDIFPKQYIQDMMEMKTETEDVKKKLLLIDIKRRPKSYGSFSNILKDVFNSKILEELCLAKNDRYAFVSQFRGYCLILNNKEFDDDDTRHGSENDIALLNDLFSKELHYHVDEAKDLTRENILKKLSDINKTVDWKLYDSFIAIIMSHGVSDHVITSDSQHISYNEIWQQFIDDNCPDLKGKPKIFIFNCCRPHKIRILPKKDISGTCKSNISDVFFMFSTLDNKFSVRDKKSGTFFTQSLYKAIIENRNHDLSEISTKANNILSDMIMKGEEKLEESQRIEYRTFGATKKFYFWP